MTRSLRIALICPFWLPSFGGGEQYDYRLAERLLREGYDVEVFTGTAAKPGFDNGAIEVVRHVATGEIRHGSWLWGNTLSPKRLKTISTHYDFMQAAVAWAKKTEPDIVIVSNGFQQADYIHGRELFSALKAMGLPVGLNHFDIAPSVEKRVRSIYKRIPGGWKDAAEITLREFKAALLVRSEFEGLFLISSPLVFSPDFVISCSDWSRRFIDPLDTVPKFTLHPILEPDYWAATVPEEARLSQRDILMINPQDRKSPEHMRELIASDAGSWTFRVLKGGWGDGLAKFKPMIADLPATRTGRVELVDYVKDIRAAYQAANALFFPSIAEGYGMTAVEPMYAGTPVVSSNYPAVIEAVGDGAATLCPLKDAPQKWAEAVHSVLSDRANWSNRAKTRAKQLTARQEREIVALKDFLESQVH